VWPESALERTAYFFPTFSRTRPNFKKSHTKETTFVHVSTVVMQRPLRSAVHRQTKEIFNLCSITS